MHKNFLEITGLLNDTHHKVFFLDQHHPWHLDGAEYCKLVRPKLLSAK